MKSGKGSVSFSNAIRKIKIHDFLKLNRIHNLKRKNLIKKKLIFLHRLKNDDEIECPICMEKLSGKLGHMKCKHYFHKECLDKWIKMSKNNDCPICRKN